MVCQQAKWRKMTNSAASIEKSPNKEKMLNLVCLWCGLGRFDRWFDFLNQSVNSWLILNIELNLVTYGSQHVTSLVLGILKIQIIETLKSVVLDFFKKRVYLLYSVLSSDLCRSQESHFARLEIVAWLFPPIRHPATKTIIECFIDYCVYLVERSNNMRQL